MFKDWTYNDEGDLIRPDGRVCSKRPNAEGYLVVKYECKQYKQHRVIFFLHNGYMPELVDHKDQDKANNRPTNLRDATASINMHNCGATAKSRTGIKGVFPTPDGYYKAQLKINGKVLCKVCKTLELAVQYRQAWEKEYGLVTSG